MIKFIKQNWILILIGLLLALVGVYFFDSVMGAGLSMLPFGKKAATKIKQSTIATKESEAREAYYDEEAAKAIRQANELEKKRHEVKHDYNGGDTGDDEFLKNNSSDKSI